VEDRKSYQRLHFSNHIDKGIPEFNHKKNFEFSQRYIKEKSILDIGCWTGGYEYLLEDFPCKVIGLEIEEKALLIARQNCKETNFIQGSALNIPFKKESFDVVTMWWVLEHLPEGSEGKAIAEINRVLKKEGVLILSTPNYHWLNNLMDPAHWLIGHRHYKMDVLKRLLKINGFTVEKADLKGGFFYASSAVLFYISKHILRREMKEFKWLRGRIEKEFARKSFADIYLVGKKVYSYEERSKV
jgi:SAM-dependent methyltransferase